MKLVKFLEFVTSDITPVIKSFYLKDDLNPNIWDGFKIKSEVSSQLLKIAQDFYNTTGLEAEIKDVILTGSLANYNWSEKYSDYDLHILIDFNDVSQDVDLVKKYVDAAKNNWNKEYNINIQDYPVEVYIQDINEPHISTGVFSLMKNKWKVRPRKKDFQIDEKEIKIKAKGIMNQIDELESKLEKPYDEFRELVKVIWDKIKNLRKSGLDSQGGEFSVGNLTFKALRRNGYIKKIIQMKKEVYQKQFK
jgi:hypothetical protein